MRMKKLLSLLLALVMVLSLVPTTVFATEGEENVVYISISFDGEYIDDKYGNLIVNVPVSLDAVAAIDLDAYGLGNMWYDAADPDEDGNYAPTALQLIIYAHENIYGGNWSDVSFSAIPGSSYFNNGVFGFTANLIYLLNGKFAIDEAKSEGSGLDNVLATSDHIILEEGDRLQMSSFGCWSFYTDDAGGLDSFTDDEGNFVYEYAAKVGEPLSVNMKQYFCDLMTGSWWVEPLANTEVFYGTSYGTAIDSFTINESGNASFTFDEPGTYYLWTEVRAASDMSTHEWCTAAMAGGDCVVSTPAIAKVTVSGSESSEQPREAQDVSAVLNATMAQLATTVTAPTFGTAAGEWTVFSLARGGYYTKDNAYFSDYYNRIVAIVNEAAASVNMNGALDKDKSTENSRLIMALSAIGKDATSVGNWNLVEAYSTNAMPWIAKQGFNGPIWALIALDSNNYETVDPELRETLINYIISKQHNDGGWSLYPQPEKESNVDITGMTLTALAPYKDQHEIAAACAKAIEWMSGAQQNNGDFAYDENAAGTVESCAWAIVGLTEWGVNPDTDPRFVKNGKSAVDALLSYYLEDKAIFEHAKGDGGNGMGTDQATYALVAYDRFVNNKTALFDYSDVEFDTVIIGKPKAYLNMPAEVTNDVGTAFTATVTIDQWDYEAGYKLLDMVMTIPDGITVKGVTPARLSGGAFSYNLDTDGKLRLAYFDATNNSNITITENTVGNTPFPAEMFTIEFVVDEVLEAEKTITFAITGMSLKKISDPTAEGAMLVVNTDDAKAEVKVVEGISYTAVCLYEGDDVDLIPATKKAVAVFVTGLKEPAALTYDDGANEYDLIYSAEMDNGDIHAYVALVEATIAMENFVNKEYYTLDKEDEPADTITFGDADANGVINAQDALAAVDAWLRKGTAPEGKAILTLNVNGDSRINTFDALGVVEKFVGGSNYGVVTKALTATTNT